MLTLFDINEEGFESIKEGERLRLLNLQAPISEPNGKNIGYGAQSGMMQLNLTKQSRVVNMTQLRHKKLKQVEIIKKHQEMVEKQVFPSELKARARAGLQPDTVLAGPDNEDWVNTADVQLYAYTLKYILSKHPVTGASELRKIIALTHEQEIIAIDIMDRSFIDPLAFPKEGSYIWFGNLNYM